MMNRSECGSRVIEAGVCLLALEVAAAVWLITGWSSLVALRFRCGSSLS